MRMYDPEAVGRLTPEQLSRVPRDGPAFPVHQRLRADAAAAAVLDAWSQVASPSGETWDLYLAQYRALTGRPEGPITDACDRCGVPLPAGYGCEYALKVEELGGPVETLCPRCAAQVKQMRQATS